MRIVTLTAYSLRPAVAVAFRNNKEDMYFNIKHGGIGHASHVYSMGIDKSLGRPTSMDERLTLTKTSYVILPIVDKKTGVQKKDRNNNPVFYITHDTVNDHTNEYVVLWEIPNKRYTNVKYTLDGDAHVIAEGSHGKRREINGFHSPSPIIEVSGPCKLSWSAVTQDGRNIEQTILFDNDSWSIGSVETVGQ